MSHQFIETFVFQEGQTAHVRCRNHKGFRLLVGFDISLPGGRVRQPRGAKVVAKDIVTLTTLKLPNGELRLNFQIGYIYASSPRNHDAAGAYRLPYQDGRSFPVIQGYGSSFTHQGRDHYAIDWAMPIGTPVLAARAGRVLVADDRSSRGGNDPIYKGQDNIVWIEHDDGTIGHYAHFDTGRVMVKEGQRVQDGEVIGLSGHTGQSSEPHLHFHVSTPVADPGGPDCYRTFPTRFVTRDGCVEPLESGKTYEAVPSASHCAGRPAPQE